MKFIFSWPIGMILCYLPVALAVGVIYLKRKEQMVRRRAPFSELQRRPAGETLRLKLEALEEKISDLFIWIVLFPTFMTLVLLALPPNEWFRPLIISLLSAAWTAFFGIRLWKLVCERADYKLGFEGERFVGEELSRLVALDFEIYHDVPFDGFNIDHVLVGSRGLFIVETKTRRKPVGEDGKTKFRVQFDGKSLRWPWGSDSHGVEQAKNNAKTLAAWLGSAAGEVVWVTPILALPGWLVDRKVPSDGLFVLNPKEIFQVCESLPEKLNEAQLRRLWHQLDQKCRIAVT